ncbi:Hypothetical_protein [Hexamita inflata]|uniref:Hypothetical_protein n=1 Tax=Hexamita inflata TaxID=28002 RepID=A0AA86R5F0_9EUKA|nr:Hypothetical protein HINF_LOCUS59451 [Hexamita inflata]
MNTSNAMLSFADTIIEMCDLNIKNSTEQERILMVTQYINTLSEQDKDNLFGELSFYLNKNKDILLTYYNQVFSQPDVAFEAYNNFKPDVQNQQNDSQKPQVDYNAIQVAFQQELESALKEMKFPSEQEVVNLATKIYQSMLNDEKLNSSWIVPEPVTYGSLIDFNNANLKFMDVGNIQPYADNKSIIVQNPKDPKESLFNTYQEFVNDIKTNYSGRNHNLYGQDQQSQYQPFNPQVPSNAFLLDKIKTQTAQFVEQKQQNDQIISDLFPKQLLPSYNTQPVVNNFQYPMSNAQSPQIPLTQSQKPILQKPIPQNPINQVQQIKEKVIKKKKNEPQRQKSKLPGLGQNQNDFMQKSQVSKNEVSSFQPNPIQQDMQVKKKYEIKQQTSLVNDQLQNSRYQSQNNNSNPITNISNPINTTNRIVDESFNKLFAFDNQFDVDLFAANIQQENMQLTQEAPQQKTQNIIQNNLQSTLQTQQQQLVQQIQSAPQSEIDTIRLVLLEILDTTPGTDLELIATVEEQLPAFWNKIAKKLKQSKLKCIQMYQNQFQDVINEYQRIKQADLKAKQSQENQTQEPVTQNNDKAESAKQNQDQKAVKQKEESKKPKKADAKVKEAIKEAQEQTQQAPIISDQSKNEAKIEILSKKKNSIEIQVTQTKVEPKPVSTQQQQLTPQRYDSVLRESMKKQGLDCDEYGHKELINIVKNSKFFQQPSFWKLLSDELQIDPAKAKKYFENQFQKSKELQKNNSEIQNTKELSNIELKDEINEQKQTNTVQKETSQKHNTLFAVLRVVLQEHLHVDLSELSDEQVAEIICEQKIPHIWRLVQAHDQTINNRWASSYFSKTYGKHFNQLSLMNENSLNEAQNQKKQEPKMESKTNTEIPKQQQLQSKLLQAEAQSQFNQQPLSFLNFNNSQGEPKQNSINDSLFNASEKIQSQLIGSYDSNAVFKECIKQYVNTKLKANVDSDQQLISYVQRQNKQFWSNFSKQNTQYSVSSAKKLFDAIVKLSTSNKQETNTLQDLVDQQEPDTVQEELSVVLQSAPQQNSEVIIQNELATSMTQSKLKYDSDIEAFIKVNPQLNLEQTIQVLQKLLSQNMNLSEIKSLTEKYYNLLKNGVKQEQNQQKEALQNASSDSQKTEKKHIQASQSNILSFAQKIVTQIEQMFNKKVDPQDFEQISEIIKGARTSRFWVKFAISFPEFNNITAKEYFLQHIDKQKYNAIKDQNPVNNLHIQIQQPEISQNITIATPLKLNTVVTEKVIVPQNNQQSPKQTEQRGQVKQTKLFIVQPAEQKTSEEPSSQKQLNDMETKAQLISFDFDQLVETNEYNPTNGKVGLLLGQQINEESINFDDVENLIKLKKRIFEKEIFRDAALALFKDQKLTDKQICSTIEMQNPKIFDQMSRILQQKTAVVKDYYYKDFSRALYDKKLNIGEKRIIKNYIQKYPSKTVQELVSEIMNLIGEGVLEWDIRQLINEARKEQ